ncbi:MAG TPA: PEP-CTERM sorting domain-containing protein [Xanthobacteraceae bacterium]|nr:PEP-CTERM sorting domain-containing protein [Xanthobacteraceae bacterium]
MKRGAIAVACLVFGGLCASSAFGSPVSITGVFEFLDNRQQNDAGLNPGTIVEFGATHVLPDGADGTTGYATRGLKTRTLNPENYTVNADFFSGGSHDTGTQASRGSWTLHFTNGPNTNTANTPGVPDSLSALPFAKNEAILGNGLTPTITWSDTAPGIDTVAIRIRDNGVNANLGGGYTADLIYKTYLDATASSFTVPTGLLKAGHEYSFEIDQVVLRDSSGPRNFPNTINQSRSFVDFSPTNGVSSTPVYLPSVDLQSNGAPSYSFDVGNVGPQTTYIDPKLAAGYVYSIGTGDPNFKSVILPVIAGTYSYTIVLPDGQHVAVLPGKSFDFTSVAAYVGGVSTFKVIGIDPSSGVSLFDPNAFVTGLTFMTNGDFTGTMDPIAATPLPSTWLLMLGGLAAIGLAFARPRKELAAASMLPSQLST